MFLARTRELKQLEAAVKENSFSLGILQGEAGIGKTALLREFLKNKTSLYFSVRRTVEELNQSFLLQEARQQGWGRTASSWEEVFYEVVKRARGESVVLALDNSENISNCLPGLWPALLAALKGAEALRLTILLAGGLEEELTARLPASLKRWVKFKLDLEPLTYVEALPLLQTYEDGEKVLLYGATGGYPCFLRLLREDQSCRENLQRLFFVDGAPLARAARGILQQRLREPSHYHAILYSIACGAQRMSLIAARVNMEMNKLSKYLKTLLVLGIIERINPITTYKEKKQQKKTYYSIKNNLLSFWYQFVFPYESLIASGRGGVILRQQVIPRLDNYSTLIFKKLCLQYCQLMVERENFAFSYEALGYWWQEEEGLEGSLLLALRKQQACCMLCVWENNRTSMEAMEKLLRLSTPLDYGEKYYLIFSKKRFQDNALAYSAQHKRVRLISLPYIK